MQAQHETIIAQDHLAERAVVGSILLVDAMLDDVIPIVSPEMFTDPRWKIVFGELIEMRITNKRIDPVTLTTKLKKRSDYAFTFPNGAMGDISEAVREVPHAAFARDYARIIRDCAIQRAAEEVGRKILTHAHASDFDSETMLAAADELLSGLRDKHRVGLDRVRHISDVLHECMARIDRRSRGELSGLKTGFLDLDKILRLRQGELVIVAARPGMGKTALALNIADYVSQEHEVLFFSLEMDSEALAERLLSGQCRIDSAHLRDGTMSHSERTALMEQCSVLAAENKITIDDTANRTVWDISAVARRHNRKSPVGLIVIDYLQLLAATDRKVPRQEQVAYMTRTLKQLARELSVPILCLAQLNRKTEDEKGNRPKLSHLRESGAIEQDADIVLFIHREGYYKPDASANEAEVLIAKQRNGSTGAVSLAWLPQYTRFESAATHIQRENYEPGFDNF